MALTGSLVSTLTGTLAQSLGGSSAVEADGIATPTLSITGGNSDVSLLPELNGSAFALTGEASDSHASTDWQISDDAGFSNIVWEDLNSASKTQVTVDVALSETTTYYARCRYKGSTYTSEYSATVSFVTSEIVVAAPTITSPSDSATDIGETPTITTSAFSVPGGSDTHAVSDWQIASDSDFNTIVVQSLDDASNLESWTVPATNLSTSTTYYVRARHGGTSEGDSDWSSTVSFTTAASFGYTFSDSDAEAVYDNMTVAPNATRAELIEDVVVDLKAKSLWTPCSALWMLAAHNNQAGRVNWKDPTSTDLTEVDSPSFSEDEGFTGNGSSSYLDTNVNWNSWPGTNGNSVSVAAWVDDISGTNSGRIIGAVDSSSRRADMLASGGTTIVAYPNYASTSGSMSVSAAGHNFMNMNRTAFSAAQMYVDGVSEDTSSSSASEPNGLAAYILALNDDGTADDFWDGTARCVFISSELTPTLAADLHEVVASYMYAVDNSVSYSAAQTALGYYTFTNSEAEAIVDEMSSEPDNTRKELIDDFVGDMKAKSVFTGELDVLQVYAAHDSQAALLNWINPTGTAATLVNSPTFTTDVGFTGNGSNSYIDTNSAASSAGNAGFNSQTASVWVHTTGGNDTLFGTVDATAGNVVRFYRDSVSTYAMTMGTRSLTSQSDTGNFFTIRGNSSNITYFADGVSVSTSTYGASPGISTQDYAVLAYNNNGSIQDYSNATVSVFIQTEGMNDTQVGDLYEAVATYIYAVDNSVSYSAAQTALGF